MSLNIIKFEMQNAFKDSSTGGFKFSPFVLLVKETP